MAEVLGAVASGFAVAGVVVKSGGAIAKRSLWGEVKNGPNTIHDLLTEIEILEPMLSDFETRFGGVPPTLSPLRFDPTGTARSAQYCRVVLEQLRRTVDDLSMEIESSRRRTRGAAKVKVVLRKEVLKRLQEQLERAVRFMNLAYQGYQTAMIQVLPDIIMLKQTLQTPSVGSQEPETEAPPSQARSESESGCVLLNAKSRPWKIHFPGWLSSTVLQVQATRAQTGWQILLEPIRIRPNDAAIFEAAASGDLQRVRDLIKNGQASMLDIDNNGGGVFRAAMSKGPSFALELLDSGLYPNPSDIQTLARHCTFSTTMFRRWRSRLPHLRDMHRVPDLLERGLAHLRNGRYLDFDDGFSCRPSQLMVDQFEPAVFKGLLTEHDPSHYEMPAHHRKVDIGGLWATEPGRFRWLLRPDGRIRRYDLDEAWEGGVSFTHVLSTCFGIQQNCMPIKSYYWLNPWTDIVRDIVSACPSHLSILSRACNSYASTYGWKHRRQFEDPQGNVHDKFDFEVTPLVNYLFVLLSCPSLEGLLIGQWPTHRRISIVPWLECLRRCGVDLVLYGAEEQRIFQGQNLKHWAALRWSSRDVFGPGYLAGPRFRGFVYGPRPEDWSLLWDMECEEFAGSFWNLVEEQLLDMPGAWTDDD